MPSVKAVSTISIALVVIGCAGQLAPQEDPWTTVGTSSASGSGSGTTGVGGAGGAPGGVDRCVVDTSALRACQATGCHTGAPEILSASLDLSAMSVTTRAKSFLDRPNVGTMGVTMLHDANGCPPGAFKLIDSANPLNSLLYLKVFAPGEGYGQPCGNKMPVIGPFTAENKACLLSWINSVIALP